MIPPRLEWKLFLRRCKSQVVDPLIFVDTNIYLDFYRARSIQARSNQALNDADVKLLARLKEVKDSLICTEQIQMEFLKNRQAVIKESFLELKAPAFPQAPALFIGSELGKALAASKEKAERSFKSLQEELEDAMKDPTAKDPVYSEAHKVFAHKSPLILTGKNHDKKRRQAVRRLAWNRFILGYPPRKARDTSIGDAVNWEWIVDCAIMSRRSIVIVSRDEDYGITLGKSVYLNEWLKMEFEERTEGKSKITLTKSLTDALQKLNIPVSKKEVESEVRFLESRTDREPSPEEYKFLETLSALLGGLPLRTDLSVNPKESEEN